MTVRGMGEVKENRSEISNLKATVCLLQKTKQTKQKKEKRKKKVEKSIAYEAIS